MKRKLWTLHLIHIDGGVTLWSTFLPALIRRGRKEEHARTHPIVSDFVTCVPYETWEAKRKRYGWTEGDVDLMRRKHARKISTPD